MKRTITIFALTFLYLMGLVGVITSLWSNELAEYGIMAMGDFMSVTMLVVSIALVFFTTQLAWRKSNV